MVTRPAGILAALVFLCSADGAGEAPRFTAHMEVYVGQVRVTGPLGETLDALEEQPAVSLAGIVTETSALRKALVEQDGTEVQCLGGAGAFIDIGFDAKVEVRDDRPIEFFTLTSKEEVASQEDRVFELRQFDQSPGAEFVLRLERIRNEAGALVAETRVWASYTAVSRESSDDVPLGVGAPIVTTSGTANVILKSKFGEWVCPILAAGKDADGEVSWLYCLLKITGPEEAAAAAAAVPEPAPAIQYSAEFRVVQALHQFGDDALRDLKPVPGARRLEGEATAFLGPEVQLGNVSFSVTGEHALDPVVSCPNADTPATNAALRAKSAHSLPPVQIELLSAPRVTTALASDTSPAPVSCAANPSVPKEDFLLGDLVTEFLKQEQPNSPNRLQARPAVVADVTTEALPYFEHKQGRTYATKQIPQSNYGIACGIVLAVLKEEGLLDVDVAFRRRAHVRREPLEGTRLPVGKPVIEEDAFRYTLQCRPEDWIGFAYPLHGRGHMFVFMHIQPVGAAPNATFFENKS